MQARSCGVLLDSGIEASISMLSQLNCGLMKGHGQGTDSGECDYGTMRASCSSLKELKSTWVHFESRQGHIRMRKSCKEIVVVNFEGIVKCGRWRHFLIINITFDSAESSVVSFKEALSRPLSLHPSLHLSTKYPPSVSRRFLHYSAPLSPKSRFSHT